MRRDEIDKPIVIFDGVCGFCDRFVALALKNDTGATLLFTPNRSNFGASLCQRLNLTEESERTIIVVIGERVLRRSDAIFFISERLGQPYSYLAFFKIIPRFLRDSVYRIVAAVRRLVPFSHSKCELLPPELKKRVIED